MKHLKTALERTARSRLVLLAAGILCALLIVMGTTFAWLVSTDTRTSAMAVMQYQFEAGLVEDPPSVPAVKGAVIQNESSARNTGDIPAFVRVMVFPTLVAADGFTLLEMQLGEQVQLGALGASWADGGDGYYYYLKLLAPGETTDDPLFGNVRLASNIAGAQSNAKLNAALIIESVDGTGDHYRGAWWDAIPVAAGPLKDVDDALQSALEGD